MKEIKDREYAYQMRHFQLHKFPSSKVGKILQQNTPKEGMPFENIAIAYLDYIASNLTNT